MVYPSPYTFTNAAFRKWVQRFANEGPPVTTRAAEKVTRREKCALFFLDALAERHGFTVRAMRNLAILKAVSFDLSDAIKTLGCVDEFVV